jgi:cytochrome P450/NADPH-cytochrome P450 reductase
MRLFPPAPRRSVTPIKDTTLGNGKYAIKAGTTCTTMTIAVHRDPLIWGEDVG